VEITHNRLASHGKSNNTCFMLWKCFGRGYISLHHIDIHHLTKLMKQFHEQKLTLFTSLNHFSVFILSRACVTVSPVDIHSLTSMEL